MKLSKHEMRQKIERCYYCRVKMTETYSEHDPLAKTIDHKIPKTRGGEGFNKGNLVVCCRRCNTEKGMLTAEEYFVVLQFRAQREAAGAWRLIVRYAIVTFSVLTIKYFGKVF